MITSTTDTQIQNWRHGHKYFEANYKGISNALCDYENKKSDSLQLH